MGGGGGTKCEWVGVGDAYNDPDLVYQHVDRSGITCCLEDLLLVDSGK